LALARGTEIFHGTIGENVHFNRPHISALDVREAISAVGLSDEVLKLPDGLNTVLQTNGAPLSASQSLRLMLARAMVDRPRLLLLDGVLDGLSDEILELALERILRKDAPWTVLIVTGRRQVAEACQRVVLLAAEPASRPAELAETAD
jgi:ABC-type multidrug transport system fused ATPase/permease subunit